MARYRFWFNDKDRNGQPLDKNVLKTAEEIAPVLTRYRYQEIDSESTCNDLLQEAVEAASNAGNAQRPTSSVQLSELSVRCWALGVGR